VEGGPVILALLLLAQPDALHPAKFGSPGGIGETRGWYYWLSYDPAAGTAEVENESGGERTVVRVLPWLTSYRELAYPGFVDELRPGERVNLFFSPDGPVKRAWLVHFQDEIGQMKGHGHFWQVEATSPGGFTARAMPMNAAPEAFAFAPGAARDLKPGDRLYLRWCREGGRRVVHLAVDEAGLGALQAAAEKRIAERVAREGMGALAEEGRILVYPGYWGPARAIKAGGAIRIGGRPSKVLAAKNLGTYGSGATELRAEGIDVRGHLRVFLP
jgi:hypothetical protein